MYVCRHRVNATLAAATGTFFSAFVSPGGVVEAVRLTPDTSSGFSTSIGLTITTERGGLDILAVSNASGQTWYPRAQAQSTGGVGLGFSSAATPPPVPAMIPVTNERIQIAVSSGAAGQRGSIDIYIS